MRRVRIKVCWFAGREFSIWVMDKPITLHFHKHIRLRSRNKRIGNVMRWLREEYPPTLRHKFYCYYSVILTVDRSRLIKFLLDNGKETEVKQIFGDHSLLS